MQIVMDDFPVIRMREHEEGEEEDVLADRDILIALLDRGERFVLVADRMPSVSDLTEMDPLERKMRAQLFKTHRAQFTRLCAGMIIVGSASNLPQALAKVMEAFTGIIGVSVVFAANPAEADAMARARLAA